MDKKKASGMGELIIEIDIEIKHVCKVLHREDISFEECAEITKALASLVEARAKLFSAC